MQHLENDMDELFQRAAENYPLKKGEGDWESIAKRIADKSDPPATVAASKSNGRKKITALLLLLFIGGVSWFIFQRYQHRNVSVSDQNVLVDNSKKAKTKTSSTEKDNSGSADKHTSVVADKSNHYNSVALAGNNHIKSETGNVTMPVGSNSKNSKEGIRQSLTGEIFNNEISFKPNNKSSSEENISQKKAGNNLAENKISAEEMLSKNKGKEVEVNAAANEDDAAIHDKKSKDKANQNFQKKKGIYVGVVAGPDFSKVHSGSFDRSGLNAGLIAGYRFNKRLSLESGINWNKKYYTTEGENFKMDKVASTMPSGMIINNLESSNSFIEIPLKVKFDFFTKRNSNLFVSGGVSAYIITREQNMYHVTYNGDNKNLLSIYKKNNYGLPAVANLSVGYEKNIFKNFDIRIEPYLKIPLRGMGVGSLPVTSTGLQIGIIGRLK